MKCGWCNSSATANSNSSTRSSSSATAEEQQQQEGSSKRVTNMAAPGRNNEKTNEVEEEVCITFESDSTGHDIPMVFPNGATKEINIPSEDSSVVNVFKLQVVDKHYRKDISNQTVNPDEHELVLILSSDDNMQNSERKVLVGTRQMKYYESDFTKCSEIHLQKIGEPHGAVPSNPGSFASSINMRPGNNS